MTSEASASIPIAPRASDARSGVDPAHFVDAQRHSRWVRRLKFVLPALALTLAAGFAAWSWWGAPVSLSLDVSGTALRDGKLVMANPKLDGFGSGDLPYTMSALRAIQDVSGGGPVELEEINAQIALSADNVADIVASRGFYHNDANKLDITSEMTVTTTDGMEARLKSASIDLGTGTLTTADPVDIRTDGSNIKSDKMTVLDGGKRLVFEQRVRVDIRPDRLTSEQTTTGSTDATH